MHFTNLASCLDEGGDIPVTIPKQVRDSLACFASIVEFTTRHKPHVFTITDVNCFRISCRGVMKSAINKLDNSIAWYCPECTDSGIITNWRDTNWDKSHSQEGLG